MTFEVLLPNGDRAEADDEQAILLAARVLTNDATDAGAAKLKRGINVYRDGHYDPILSMVARG